MRVKTSYIVRLLATIAFLYALLVIVPYQSLIGLFRHSRVGYLLLAIAIFFLQFLIAAGRWRFFLRACGVDAGFREPLYGLISSMFVNLFFPSYVAGDTFRVYAISARHGSISQAAASVLADRLSGFIALSFLGAAALLFSLTELCRLVVVVPIISLCLLAFACLYILFSATFLPRLFPDRTGRNRIVSKILAFHEQFRLLRHKPQAFFAGIIFSLFIQFLSPVFFFLAARAFGVILPIMAFLVLVPIVLAVSLIPITIAGAGTREASAVYFFSLIGITKEISLSLSLFNLFCIILCGVIGGICYVSVYHRWFQRAP